MKIGVTNLKGGVGKTTLSTNLAICFAHMGYSVCIVDTDATQAALQWYWARDENKKPEIMVIGAIDDKSLNKTVDSLNQKYEIVIMDGTPTLLSQMNVRIMMASDLLFIPMLPGPSDARSMKEFLARIDQVNEIKKVAPYFIFNKYNETHLLDKGVHDDIKAAYEIPILRSTLKSRTAYGEASLSGIGVYEHTDEKAKIEMAELTKEILGLAKKHSLIK